MILVPEVNILNEILMDRKLRALSRNQLQKMSKFVN